MIKLINTYWNDNKNLINYNLSMCEDGRNSPNSLLLNNSGNLNTIEKKTSTKIHNGNFLIKDLEFVKKINMVILDSNYLFNLKKNKLLILKKYDYFLFNKPKEQFKVGNSLFSIENIKYDSFIIKKKELIQSGLFFHDFSYNFIFIYTQTIVMLALALVLYNLSKILSKKIYNIDKKSAYECGFEPFFILQNSIEISFILVAFIFLIFDLELIFLSAFIFSNGDIGSFGIVIVFFYLFSVWFMIAIEIKSGILSWPVWNHIAFKREGNILNYLKK